MSLEPVDSSDELVRPYTATRGRARPSRVLPLEAMVTTTPYGRSRLPLLLLEQKAIVAMCQLPQGVIEIAAKLRLPIGVTRVLISDAAAEHLVEVSQLTATDIPDLTLLDRVLTSLRTL